MVHPTDLGNFEKVLLSLDEQTLTELCRRYDETSDAETRTRYQMLAQTPAAFLQHIGSPWRERRTMLSY